MQACPFPLWENLTENQQRPIKMYNDKIVKRMAKGKAVQRDYATESFINAIFGVDNGIMPNVDHCGHAEYHIYRTWEDFLAAVHAWPTGQAALDALKCPVTKNWFIHPMLLPSGHSCDMSVLPRLRRDGRGQMENPMTREFFDPANVRPNITLEAVLGTFSIPHQHGQADLGGKYRKSRRYKMKRATKKRHSTKNKKLHKP